MSLSILDCIAKFWAWMSSHRWRWCVISGETGTGCVGAYKQRVWRVFAKCKFVWLRLGGLEAQLIICRSRHLDERIPVLFVTGNVTLDACNNEAVECLICTLLCGGISSLLCIQRQSSIILLRRARLRIEILCPLKANREFQRVWSSYQRQWFVFFLQNEIPRPQMEQLPRDSTWRPNIDAECRVQNQTESRRQFQKTNCFALEL